jgi:hypothetical protein
MESFPTVVPALLCSRRHINLTVGAVKPINRRVVGTTGNMDILTLYTHIGFKIENMCGC